MGKGYAEGSAVEERLAALERGDDLLAQLDAGRAAVYGSTEAELERLERAGPPPPEERQAVFGSTEDDPEKHFIGWLDDVDPDALFASGEAWGIQVVRRRGTR